MARSRRGGQAVSNASVTPVAIKDSPGAAAVIPINLKETGDSAQAVIPVEVMTTGAAPRKRAAVIPVRVEGPSAHARSRRSRARPTATRKRRVEPRPLHPERVETARQYPISWRTLFINVIDEITQTERAALQAAIEYGRTAAALLQFLFWPLLGRPTAARKATARGHLLPWPISAAAGSELAKAA